MNNNTYDHYNVELTGELNSEPSRSQIIDKIATTFNLPKEKISQLLNGKPQIIRKDIPHKEAYQIQQALIQCGAQTRLVRIKVQEKPASFSLVPEGEEQTSFQDLTQKITEGTLVECPQCHNIQPPSSFCVHCGSALSDTEPSPTKHSKKILYLGVVSVLMAMVIIAFILW
ncbi:zinc ribbon domain-containing protein [Aliikangiella maris]|uniref:Zinc ribbon domain-containing protein n=2 Tax=Aliikangiella maris TaxID=3162458 RepID=A0ABV3MM85_9GAMM